METKKGTLYVSRLQSSRGIISSVTDRPIDTHTLTHTQNDYSNPVVHALRVNDIL